MISVQDAFLKFKSKLELTKTEREDASKRHYEVRDCIRKEFQIDRDFLTGSYGRDTKTKPLKDIDVFFVLGEQERWRRDKSPEDTLKAFEDCLRKEYDSVEANRRCITVEFEKVYQTQEEEGKILSIDAVPAFLCDEGYEIPDRILGEWIKTNPETHKEEATKKNAELNKNWNPIVKMLKKWNAEAGKPIKPSFLIEVMAQQLFDPPFNNYTDEIQRFFYAARMDMDKDWPDPAGLGPPVSDQMDSQKCIVAKEALRKAEQLAMRAVRAAEQDRTVEALSLWRELFGSYFPKS